MRSITGQTVYLPGMVREESILEDWEFTDCTLIGPIALAPLDGAVSIKDNTFDSDNPDALFIVVPADLRISWAVGLRNVTIRNSRLQRVALVGTADAVAKWRAGFKAI